MTYNTILNEDIIALSYVTFSEWGKAIISMVKPAMDLNSKYPQIVLSVLGRISFNKVHANYPKLLPLVLHAHLFQA